MGRHVFVLFPSHAHPQMNRETDRQTDRQADGGKADRDIQNKKENLLISSSTMIGTSGLSGAT